MIIPSVKVKNYNIISFVKTNISFFFKFEEYLIKNSIKYN